MLLRLSTDFRRAMDLSLVLDQEGIAHELRRIGDERWALRIEEQDAGRAEAAIAAFERENPPEVRRPEPVGSTAGAVACGLVFFLALLTMYVWTGPDSDGSPWFARGSADAAAILRGEWWRAVTALTLHGDAGHVAGNAVLGGLLLALLARSIGPGMASALMLLSGVGGTLAAAGLVRQNFVSIGASTAVFGAVGATGSLGAARRPRLDAPGWRACATCIPGNVEARRSRWPSLRIRLRRAGGRGGVAPAAAAEPGRSGVARRRRRVRPGGRMAGRVSLNASTTGGPVGSIRIALPHRRWMTLGINLSPGDDGLRVPTPRSRRRTPWPKASTR